MAPSNGLFCFCYFPDMAPSNGRMRYPPRLYPKGKAPMQDKSMNHYFKLSALCMVKEAVGLDVWKSLKKSSIGVLLRLKDMDYIWSANLIHHFLTNQLYIRNIHEIWSLIGGQPLWFSLFEYESITGLNCEPLESREEVDIDHTKFWQRLGVPSSSGPKLKELTKKIIDCRKWGFEERMMMGLLCILSIAIYGMSLASRIPLAAAKRVFDFEVFDRYPWGRIGFNELINSVNVVSYEGARSYTMRGCVHTLLTWAFEYVPGLGEKFGNKIEKPRIPLLSWESSRPRWKWEEFFAEETEKYQKVRVNHLLEKPLLNMYPPWEDKEVDEVLDNLLVDIITEKLDETAWDSDVQTMGTKRSNEAADEGNRGFAPCWSR